MRLVVKMKSNKLILPLNYKSIIQGVIYNMMNREKEGNFYHNYGYHKQEKIYKMFVFSDLYGQYKIENKKIIFSDVIKLYIGALDKELFKIIYEYLIQNDYLFINNQKVNIAGIDILNLPHFNGVKDIIIKTITPVVTYTCKDKYFTYYNPQAKEFENLVRANINHKMQAYNYPTKECIFKINEVIYKKKKLIHFKNTFYEAYQCELAISTNYESLKIIYDTGLSAKGSCGFGMIEYKNEKSILSI